MNIQEIEIDKLHEYENNPRINDNAVESVAESIKQFGFKVPIVIDSNNVIIAGHTRLKAARLIKMETVPCIVADDLTPEQVKAFRIADNKTGELAEWDMEALERELQELAAFDVDMSVFGFDVEAFEERTEVTEDEVPEIDEEAEPKTKIGDIWLLGNHRLICGDSTDSATIERLMNGNKVDLLLTDPPYNVAYEGKTKDKLTIQNDNMNSNDFRIFLQDAFKTANEVMKDGAGFYIWHADSERLNFQGACVDVGWDVRQCLIWNKNQFILGRQDYHWKHEPCLYGWKGGAGHYFTNDRTLTTVIDENKPNRNDLHPTMKPVALFSRLIENSSKKGNNILDTFGGSGTTLIACEQLERDAYLCELDPRYCDVIIQRWENLTGNSAVKVAN